MKKNILNSVMIVMLAGCASTPQGAPTAPTPGPAAAAPAPAPEAPAGNAFYTTQQASRGDGLFRDNCVSCHSSSEFAGASFQRRWRNRAVGDIYEFVLYSMPDDNPGGLPEQTYADIVAYMLSMNDFPSGDSELPTEMEELMEMMMFTGAGGDDR